MWIRHLWNQYKRKLFMRNKTCCESLNFNCNQGRNCPRPYTLTTTNSDHSDPGYSGYIQDLVYSGLQLSGALILLVVGLGGLGYGLRAAGWI